MSRARDDAAETAAATGPDAGSQAASDTPTEPGTLPGPRDPHPRYKEARAREGSRERSRATAPGTPTPDLDRAVRVAVTPRSALDGDPTVVVAPPAEPLRLFESALGETGVLGGVVAGARPGPGSGTSAQNEQTFGIIVDGRAEPCRLGRVDQHRAVLERGSGDAAIRTAVLLGEARRQPDGSVVREVVVGGWRFEVAVEPERRAALRERSRRGGRASAGSGRLEIRAIIPGRIVAVSVGPGDPVTAGQQLLVLEAMKMQNELRAPREGTVASVAVAVGTNVEVGDVLMVIE